MASYEYPWIYNNKEFESEDIGTYYGFIYKITNILELILMVI